MKIQESAENYLEAILILKQNKGSVRSIDIAHYLNFSKPSVSIAMKNLRNSDMITVDSDGFISLTEAGHKIADTIFERHTVLSNMLIKLGVPAEIAAEDACRMEHVISPESFHAIKAHLNSEEHIKLSAIKTNNLKQKHFFLYITDLKSAFLFSAGFDNFF